MKFDKKPVLFLYSDPYSQVSTTLNTIFSSKPLNGEVKRIKEFSEFSIMNNTPCCSHSKASLQQKSQRTFADSTLARLTPFNVGNPSGYLPLRRGRWECCERLMKFHTVATRPDVTSSKINCCTQVCFKFCS